MKLSRRDLLASAAGMGFLPALSSALRAAESAAPPRTVLSEFSYGDVTLESALHSSQLHDTQAVLMNMSDDSLLKPFRQMAGQPAPGEDLGGWYHYDPNFDWHKDDAGFAPGATFGQWVSALARYYAITGSQPARDKVLRLNRLYGATISEAFYEKNRFPAYCYDKLLLGLIDSHQLAGDPSAFALLEQTTNAALPHLPAAAVDRELAWRPGKDQSYRWDESYTNPENLFLAYQRGAGKRYLELAKRFMDDSTWFDPLARGENVLGSKHAYSYVNSLSSAMQAYLTLDSTKHLHAAVNAFSMLKEQSYPTGGWGPDEKLVAPGSDTLFASLQSTHNSFETPCGSYAHFKIARYLLRVTHDSRYGDSMERVMYNTVLGARPMQQDGRAFYYSDYNFDGHKVYSNHRFPCCSGTLPQVATDYGINSYLRDEHGVFVNLYVPSTVRWAQGSAHCALRQESTYPFSDLVKMTVSSSKPTEFSVRLRIPEWATGARVEVNGKQWPDTQTGRFAVIRREWRDGDIIELNLPRPVRLEPVDARHPMTVATVAGPLVLFAMTKNGQTLAPSREELLATRQMKPVIHWGTHIGSSKLNFLPFVAIGNETYSTFLNLRA